ncbi:MAG: hypothetical protein ABI776_06800 [Nocardioidaceae bacterium]
MPDLVRPAPLDPTGRSGPTRGQKTGPRWRRTGPGLYVPSWVDGDIAEQRILEQSMRLTGGAVTGWASCRMHRATFFDGLQGDGRTPVPVPLACTPLHQIRRMPGDDLRRDILHPWEILDIEGVPCTMVPRATFDAMRYARTARAAVAALDMMMAAGLVALSTMREYVDAHPAWTGVQQSRDALLLADEGSRSPQETRLRLVWQLDAQRGRPLVNRPLFDLGGRLLGYPDLLDPEAGVVGEYDGEDHRHATQHSSDVDREARFRDHGLEVARFTGPDMRDVGLVTARIHSAYRRAWRVPPERRTWTLEPPAWWRAA